MDKSLEEELKRCSVEYGVSWKTTKKLFESSNDSCHTDEEVVSGFLAKMDNARKVSHRQRKKGFSAKLSFWSGPILNAMLSCHIKKIDWYSLCEAGFKESQYIYHAKGESLSFNCEEGRFTGFSYREFFLLSAVYSCMDVTTVNSSGEYLIPLRMIWECLYPKREWRHPKHIPNREFLHYEMVRLMGRIRKLYGTYTSFGKHQIDKPFMNGEFFLRTGTYAFGYIHDITKQDEERKNHRLDHYENMVYSFLPSELFLLMKKRRTVVYCPEEYLCYSNEISNDLAKMYLAFRVLLSSNMKNAMRPTVNFSTFSSSVGEVSRKFVHGYLAYLKDSGFIDGFKTTASSISWSLPVDTGESTGIFVEMKDDDKHVVNIAMTPEVELVSGKLRIWNAFLGTRRVTIGKKRLSTKLKAIYNRGSWDCGGRLYSVGKDGFQCVKSSDRKNILINGKETVELDFQCYHPHLLYAVVVGMQYSGDAYCFYDNPSYGKELSRVISKRAFNIAINSKGSEEAVLALSSCISKDCGIDFSVDESRRVLESAWKAHPSLRECFFSDYGVRLQNLDAKIAIDVIMELERKKIPCLPVHDSFIVAKKNRTELERVMESVYSRYANGFVCEIVEK